MRIPISFGQGSVLTLSTGANRDDTGAEEVRASDRA